MMKVETTGLCNAKLITPTIFTDYRGEFIETFSVRDYKFFYSDGNGYDTHDRLNFIQDDTSVSYRKTLRGFHGDGVTWKLVSCAYGRLYSVIVDLREASPTYLQWKGFLLDDKKRQQLLVPAGYGNSYLCLSEQCMYTYKQTEYYRGADKQFTIRWNDPVLGVDWPIANPILSERDKKGASVTQLNLKDFE